MHITVIKKGTAVGLFVLFLAGAVFGAGRPVDPQPLSSTQNWRSIELANGKLERLRTVAFELGKVGESIDVSLRSLPGNHEGHAYRLMEAREQINQAGVLLADLQGMKHQLAPWQQQAIDRIHPIAAQLASHTSAAIHHLNERPHARITSEYTDQLRGIVEHSSAMRQTLNNFLDYADSRGRVQQLETSLEIERS